MFDHHHFDPTAALIRRHSESTTSELSVRYPTPVVTPRSDLGDETGYNPLHRADSFEHPTYFLPHHQDVPNQPPFPVARRFSVVGAGGLSTLADSASGQRRANVPFRPGASHGGGTPAPPSGSEDTAAAPASVKKTRSKTGCRSCRDRKKKCDEVKPECTACRKNNLVCVYEPKGSWQPGGKKASSTAAADAAADANRWPSRSSSPGSVRLPPLMEGLDEGADHELLNYFFKDHVASALALGTPGGGAGLLTLLMPIANEHEVVLRSLLFLAASFKLAQHAASGTEVARWQERQLVHGGRVVPLLRGQVEAEVTATTIVAITAASMLLCLQELYFGECLGGPSLHLSGLKGALPNLARLGANIDLYCFASDVARFVDFTLTIFRPPAVSVGSTTPLHPPLILPPLSELATAGANGSPTLLTNLVPSFEAAALIRQVRDQIRPRGPTPETLLHDDLATAYELLNADFRHDFGPHSPQHVLGMLYRAAILSYLQRARTAARPAQPSKADAQGLRWLAYVRWSDDEVALAAAAEGAGQAGVVHPEPLLLPPLLLLACAAFAPEQRAPIAAALEKLAAWWGGKAPVMEHARRAVRRVWELMDAGQEVAAWHWEEIAVMTRTSGMPGGDRMEEG